MILLLAYQIIQHSFFSILHVLKLSVIQITGIKNYRANTEINLLKFAFLCLDTALYHLLAFV